MPAPFRSSARGRTATAHSFRGASLGCRPSTTTIGKSESQLGCLYKHKITTKKPANRMQPVSLRLTIPAMEARPEG